MSLLRTYSQRNPDGCLLINGAGYCLGDVLTQGQDSRILSATPMNGGGDPAAFVVKHYHLRPGEGERRERVYLEIRAGRSLRHSRGVVRLLGSRVIRAGGEEDVYLLMRRLPCCEDVPPADPAEVMCLCLDMTYALEALAARGWVHGDIKPSNLFRAPSDGWQLGDFGSLCRVGNAPVYGSEGYCAPEAWRGEPCDGRADQYALGVTMYRLLSGGRLPFCARPCAETEEAEVYAAIRRRLKGEPIPPPEGVLSQVAELVCKMTAFRPEDRFRTPQELRESVRLLNFLHYSHRNSDMGGV